MIYPSKNLRYPVLDQSLSRGLVGYWPLDDQGGIAYDRSGSGNHGTLVADTHSVISTRGRCLSFDGTGDYVGIPSKTYDLGTGTTFSFWAKRGITGIDMMALGNSGSDVNKWIWLNAGNGLFLETDTNGDYFYGIIAVDTNWHHYVLSVKDYNGVVYEDGADKTHSASSDVTNNITLDRIGSAKTLYFFNGLLSNVSIHNRALSAQEVQQLYRYGIHKHRDLIELWTAASPASGTIIPRIQYYNQQMRA